MWATAIIVFREILEAALIVSLVVAATKGMPRRGLYINAGIGAGVLGAAIIALLAAPIANIADGMGQEIFNASVLMLAVFMLTWHLVWMRKHSKQIASDIKGLSQQLYVGKKSMVTVSVIVALAILREGAEIILLLFGMTAAGTNVMQQLSGGAIGLVAGSVLGAAIYFSLVRIPVRYFFQITGTLLLLLAAGLAAQAAANLSQADILPVFISTVWDTSNILSEQSLLGQILHSLIGYTSHPSGIQIIFYVVTLLTIGTLMRLANNPPIKFKSASLVGLVVATLVTVMFVSTSPAHASDKIYSPYVEKGEFELEHRGHVTSDSDAAKDKSGKHKTEIVYAFTDYWSSGIIGVWETNPGSSREFVATGWENIFPLTEKGQFWMDVGLYLEYEFADQSSAADKVETKILLERPGTQFTSTANIIFEREVGSNSNSETEFELLWRTKYRWKKNLEPGIEIFSKFGEIGNSGSFDSQNHSVGPVIVGKIPFGRESKFKYEFGYLVGISDAAADSTWKSVIELETRF